MNYQNAKTAIENAKLVMELDSSSASDAKNSDYIAATQSPAANSEVAEGTKIFVKFVKRETD